MPSRLEWGTGGSSGNTEATTQDCTTRYEELSIPNPQVLTFELIEITGSRFCTFNPKGTSAVIVYHWPQSKKAQVYLPYIYIKHVGDHLGRNT